MNPSNSRHPSLSRLIKERRSMLRMTQPQIAERMRVTAECVGHWEKGTRRMELDKLPRLAEILQLDEQYVCRLALSEFHPALYDTLFGSEQPQPASGCTS
jgi:transcriptional regulator with XRE-family HTH domain